MTSNYIAISNGALMTTPKIDTEEVAGESMKEVIWINRWKVQRMMTWKMGKMGKMALPIPSNHIPHTSKCFSNSALALKVSCPSVKCLTPVTTAGFSSYEG